MVVDHLGSHEEIAQEDEDKRANNHVAIHHIISCFSVVILDWCFGHCFKEQIFCRLSQRVDLMLMTLFTVKCDRVRIKLK